jgi:hypothetical protein
MPYAHATQVSNGVIEGAEHGVGLKGQECPKEQQVRASLIGREDAFFRPSAQHYQLPFTQAIHMGFQPSSVKDFPQFREGSEGTLYSLANFFSGDLPFGHPHHLVRETLTMCLFPVNGTLSLLSNSTPLAP